MLLVLVLRDMYNDRIMKRSADRCQITSLMCHVDSSKLGHALLALAARSPMLLVKVSAL